MAFIELKELSLRYPIYGTHARSLKSSVLHYATGGRINRDHAIVQVEALKKISFTLQNGDRLGLIGPNGSGKTSLLKILAKIYEPTSGSLAISGKTHCLFEIMVGMDQALTGIENIFLRGYLLGLSKQKITQTVPEIEHFTELGEYMRLPLRSYSAGMLVRLAFGIVTNFPSEILLIDEVMGVGDARFIHKAQERMESLVHRAKILVLSTHEDALIKKFCNKVLYLERGEMRFFGPVQQGIDLKSLILNYTRYTPIGSKLGI